MPGALEGYMAAQERTGQRAAVVAQVRGTGQRSPLRQVEQTGTCREGPAVVGHFGQSPPDPIFFSTMIPNDWR